MESASNGQPKEGDSKKYAAVQPGSSVPYAEIDQIRAEIARDRDSDQNSEKIIKVFQSEIEKDYFAQRVAAIVLREKKVRQRDGALRIGTELLKFIVYAAIGAALTKWVFPLLFGI